MWMKEANEERDWLHTSCILSMLYNTVSKKKKKPDDFNPLKQSKKRTERTMEGAKFKDFGHMFFGKQRKRQQEIENVSRGGKRSSR